MKKHLIIGLCLVLLLSACEISLQPMTADTEATGETTITDTTQGGEATTSLDAGQQLTTPEPSPTSTPEPPPPTASTLSNANCRSGPGGNFDNLALLEQGESAEVIGQNNAGLTAWYLLELEDGTQCWVSGDKLEISGDTGTVAEVTSPPTPTLAPPSSLWTGTWTIWQNTCYNNMAPGCEEIFTVTMTITGPNTLTFRYTLGGGFTCTDTLTVSADGYRADGSENCTGGMNYEAHLVLDSNKNQFRGRWNEVGVSNQDGYYCGAKNGYSKPNPTMP